MRWLALALLTLTGTAFTAPRTARGGEAPALVRQEWVEEALVAAGANRAEIERVLVHFAATNDAERLHAARFLVANMPGKGYVVTALKDAKGNVIPYDPLAYPDFKASEAAFDALEKQHGKLEFKRDHLVADLETLKADYLIRHIEGAFQVWEGTPVGRRVSFPAFLDYVLPYRGTEEPAEAWLEPMRARLTEARKAPGAPGVDADAATLWRWVNGLVASWVRFNERYYLHPTDQGFAEMGKSCAGRCEDMTNMTTYAARALGLATAADYTPAWGHRDNNHAWNVLLDADGKGHDPAQSHAPKVYRKTFAIQRDSLPFVLPKGVEPPNRFLASRAQIDVTRQYGSVSKADVYEPSGAWGGQSIAYACVFNGGEWVAVDWTKLASGPPVGVGPGGRAPRVMGTFDGLGRGSGRMLYLPTVWDGQKLVAVDAPFVTGVGTTIPLIPEGSPGVTLHATAVAPSQRSADTHVTTPVSELVDGTTYLLQQWSNAGWKVLKEVVAGKQPLRFDDLPADGLYWLVAKDSKRLERPFTIENGRQRFW